MTPRAPSDSLHYRRSRFVARLPVTYRYTRSHYWLHGTEAGVWRIGLTPFATRMLGDLVECTFTPAVGDRIALGDTIGAVEGFKAMSDLYAVMAGRFAGGNPALETDITVIEKSPYEAGWLYSVEGDDAPDTLTVDDYVHVLDATIDRMLASRGERPEE